MKSKHEEEHQKLREACSQVTGRLSNAADGLRKLLKDRVLMSETPRNVTAMMDVAVETISEALRVLQAVSPVHQDTAPAAGEGPTRQQGQFLAFIREYVMKNSSGIAPSHADFQRFFNLTPPSVNSMLIRLEQRGFIRRKPGKARAIELVINPDWIPPLDRPFKF
jgi:DNA-binding MarR family transcriptional regulator